MEDKQTNKADPQEAADVSSAAQQPQQQRTGEQNDLMGILSIVFAFLFPPVGLILGIVGLNDAKRENRSKTLSKVGIGLNAGLMIISLLAIVMFVVFFVAVGSA